METIAHFDVFHHHNLDPAGMLSQDLPKFAQDAEKLITLYKTMVLTRAFDTKAVALQRTGKMGTYASTLGQEAIGTAMGFAMKPEDVLVPYYRDYAAQLQRGVKLSELYAYWGGDERGSCYESNKAKEDLPICVPIASQSLHATGIAYAMKLRKQKRAVVTSIGEGGTSEGDFYEALNVAGAWNLPVVFIVNNNQWAISVPLSKQTHTQTIAQKAIAAGIHGEQVDGNDVIAMVDRINVALDNARNGGGPTLIEAMTYRLCDHTTADDATRYQPKEDVEAAWQKEPLLRMKSYLLAQGLWNEDKEQSLKTDCEAQIAKVVEDYQALSPQGPEAMFDHMYATLPHSLEEQRSAAMEAANG